MQNDRTVNPNRVVFIVDKMYGYGRGGTEQQVVRLVRGLRAAALDIEVIFLRKDDWHNLAGFDFPWAELKLPTLFPFGAIRGAIALRNIAKASGTRVLFSFFDDSMFTAAVAKLLMPSLKLVVTQRNLGTERSSVTRILLHFPMMLANRILVNSRAVHEQVSSEFHVDRKRLLVIENLPPVADSRCVQPESVVVEAIRELRQDGLSVGVVVANLRPVKGVQDLIASIAMPPASNSAIGIVVMGDGPSRCDLEAQARSLGVERRFRFVGHVTNVGPALPLFDFAVLPSHAEGSANAGLEFLSAGLPIIATNIGGNRTLLEDSLAGLAVPARCPQEMSSALVMMTEDTSVRATLIRNAAKFSATRADEGVVLGQYMSLIREVVSD